jgi:hypothetical protein
MKRFFFLARDEGKTEQYSTAYWEAETRENAIKQYRECHKTSNVIDTVPSEVNGMFFGLLSNVRFHSGFIEPILALTKSTNSETYALCWLKVAVKHLEDQEIERRLMAPKAQIEKEVRAQFSGVDINKD